MQEKANSVKIWKGVRLGKESYLEFRQGRGKEVLVDKTF